MADAKDVKVWTINPDKPITFKAALTNEDFSAIQDSIAAAVRQTVLAKLEEHGFLERGEPVTFDDGGKNIIIKPPSKPTA
jgi:hypothetical protein